MQCLNELLAQAVKLYGDKPFLVTDSETITYAELNQRAARLANVLAGLGVTKGDPVGLFLPSNARLVAGYWACQKIGAIPTPMSVMYRDTEVQGIVARTEMKVIITDQSTFSYANAARAQIDCLKHVLLFGGALDGGTALEPLLAGASAQFADVRCGPADTANLFFTSGTTGLPKGAMQSQLNQYSMLMNMMVYLRLRFGSEVFLDVLPLFNNFGATVLMNLSVFSGATMVMHERWDTRNVLDAIKRHKVSFFAGTPTMFIYLCNEFDATRDDLSSLRLALTGGAAVPPEIIKQFEGAFGVRLVQCYGATETTGTNTGEPLVGIRRPGSAGLPIGSSTIEIVDDDGTPVAAGERGEVRVSGDCVGKGYWRDAETTAKIFTAKGWLSGDIGYVDADGYLYIVDRKKDVIISGGYNIYPLEVEDLLYKHPAVAVCSLVGVADAVKGEIPAAVIVLKPGSQTTPAEIIDYCRQHVAAFKAPRQVYFLDAMPTGPTGKILKRELRSWIKEGRAQPAA